MATFIYPSQQVTISGAATEATLLQVEANTADALEQLQTKLAGSLVPLAFDEQELTYVASGNGVGEIETVTFKLAASVVAVLTLTYDSSNRLVSVVKS